MVWAKYRVGGDYETTMGLGYAWFDSYDSVGYVLTLHVSPHTFCHRSLCHCVVEGCSVEGDHWDADEEEEVVFFNVLFYLTCNENVTAL